MQTQCTSRRIGIAPLVWLAAVWLGFVALFAIVAHVADQPKLLRTIHTPIQVPANYFSNDWDYGLTAMRAVRGKLALAWRDARGARKLYLLDEATGKVLHDIPNPNPDQREFVDASIELTPERLVVVGPETNEANEVACHINAFDCSDGKLVYSIRVPLKWPDRRPHHSRRDVGALVVDHGCLGIETAYRERSVFDLSTGRFVTSFDPVSSTPKGLPSGLLARSTAGHRWRSSSDGQTEIYAASSPVSLAYYGASATIDEVASGQQRAIVVHLPIFRTVLENIHAPDAAFDPLFAFCCPPIHLCRNAFVASSAVSGSHAFICWDASLSPRTVHRSAAGAELTAYDVRYCTLIGKYRGPCGVRSWWFGEIMAAADGKLYVGDAADGENGSGLQLKIHVYDIRSFGTGWPAWAMPLALVVLVIAGSIVLTRGALIPQGKSGIWTAMERDLRRRSGVIGWTMLIGLPLLAAYVFAPLEYADPLLENVRTFLVRPMSGLRVCTICGLVLCCFQLLPAARFERHEAKKNRIHDLLMIPDISGSLGHAYACFYVLQLRSLLLACTVFWVALGLIALPATHPSEATGPVVFLSHWLLWLTALGSAGWAGYWLVLCRRAFKTVLWCLLELALYEVVLCLVVHPLLEMPDWVLQLFVITLPGLIMGFALYAYTIRNRAGMIRSVLEKRLRKGSR